MMTCTEKRVSQDGSIKYLLKTASGHSIESVFFRLDNRTTADYAFTLCLSSQSGCALKCSFCATGRVGLLANLSAREIIDQLNVVLHDLRSHHHIEATEQYHIALMGMGEPLHNFDAVCSFYHEVHGRQPYLSKMSLSTVGLAPKIETLAYDETINYDLFLSLHSPFNEERSELMPINKKYTMTQSIAACSTYAKMKNTRVKISYMLIEGINDTERHAIALSKLLSPAYFDVQLLIYNPIHQTPYQRPDIEKAMIFQSILRIAGLDCHTVVSKGLDIMAGCGQLFGKHHDTQKI